MKPRLIFLTVGLITAIVLSSCAPAVTSPPVAPIASPLGTVASAPATSAPTDLSAPEATVSDPTQAVEVQAVATSRGPNLEATDPASVSLASGQLQLVEFFRFT